MIIQYSKVSDSTIGADGVFSKTAVWTLTSDIDPDVMTPAQFESFRTDVETWSGSIGDDFRIPVTEEPFYTSDENWYVSAISVKTVVTASNPNATPPVPARLSATVTFTGKDKYPVGGVGLINNINIQRDEKIADLSNPKKTVSFTGKGIVSQAAIKTYRNITGKTIQELASSIGGLLPKKLLEVVGTSEDYLLSSINENTTSQNNYEVTMVLQKKPEPQKEPDVKKKTYDVKLAEYKLTAEQCGWKKSSDPNKSWEKIAGWTPTQSCPLITTEALSEQFIDVPIKCLMVVETSYIPGDLESVKSDLAAWLCGGIFTNDGPEGFTINNWLKINQEKKETITITETSKNGTVKSVKGTPYTKVVRYYQAAPAAHNWNEDYFSTIG